MNEDAPIFCAGCGTQTVAKRGSWCFDCVNGTGFDRLRSKSKGDKRGRPRISENLREPLTASVDSDVAAKAKASGVSAAEVWTAFFTANWDELDRLKRRFKRNKAA